MQVTEEDDRTRALLRAFIGRDGEGGGGEEHLRRLLPPAERMAWRTHGQPEGAPWGRLLAAIGAELSVH